MNLTSDIKSKKERVSIIGLGYVGLPIAIAFAKKTAVIGFDINKEKIMQYKKGVDATNEVGDDEIVSTSVLFTSDEKFLSNAKFHIVAVPTPVNDDHTPNLAPLEKASEILARNMVKGSVVVYESTVYPGVTEEICIPILERGSGLKCGIDFQVGYSPERINPGDKVHRLENIVKIASATDQLALETIADIYSLVVEAGVYKAESIRIAEAAKVIENSQRDINIAFMNELAIVFNRMGIDTKSVLSAARTKWNFLNFAPGLVGGHCIGVDPYYLTYKAEQLGYNSQVILAGRRINDGMGKYVAENVVKCLIKADKTVKNASVGILGFTFKENCPDTRNTKIYDIVRELREYGIEPVISDPRADKMDTERLYDIRLSEIKDIKKMDAIVLAVAHKEFTEYDMSDVDAFFKGGRKILVDVKGVFSRTQYEDAEYIYWRL